MTGEQDKEPVSASQDEARAPVPTTEDGIPLIVNGVELNQTQIAALREARDRRAAIDAAADVPKEVDGADRVEATRYGDWEKAGRAIDFS